jgi:MFS family permease
VTDLTLSAVGRDRMATRAVAAATIGTALEWFDFTLYGAVSATVLPKLFFPTMDPTAALLASLATFGVGLGARPLGAIVCGYLGDKLGRRKLLLGTVTIMGLASVLIGLLPTYASIGVTAPILLVALRIIQGFALGGESTGAQLMALEHAKPDRRGKYSGLLGTCSPLSQILANAVLFVLSAGLAPADFESYGWRIPFVLSFILVAVGLYIRLKVSETPAFVALDQTKVVSRRARHRRELQILIVKNFSHRGAPYGALNWARQPSTRSLIRHSISLGSVKRFCVPSQVQPIEQPCHPPAVPSAAARSGGPPPRQLIRRSSRPAYGKA